MRNVVASVTSTAVLFGTWYFLTSFAHWGFWPSAVLASVLAAVIGALLSKRKPKTAPHDPGPS